ncbi:MAG: phosphate ABC transporter ATP-binding protein [Halomonadaceae bacterium]|nr:MAG: phosphate ABC transporter ATP-binding protein [Halomonadaceae bacterium]
MSLTSPSTFSASAEVLPAHDQVVQSRAPVVSIDQVSVFYGDQCAIQRASLTVQPGQLMALVGPSGCGKTSLLHSINRLTDSVAGCRVTGETRVGELAVNAPATSLRELRTRIGMVFQQPNPFPLSVADNIRFPLKEHGLRNKQALNQRVEQNLRAVGLWDEVKDRLQQSALSLSGGQQQRLCLARALAMEPEVLLLDEPCSALDPVATETIEQLIRSLKGHYTVLMVTHNLAQARRIADAVTVCWVDEGCGCVVETGSREAIFVNSSNPVTRAYCSGEKG